MICSLDSPQRLYLSKGDQNIYIDNCKISQHHIDGIRFLYRQYKKQKSGVILNHRPGYSSNLQIVLFVKAIRCLLKKPVLVLCKEGTERSWMEQFETWTDFYDEVVLETQKPFIKKLVLINTMSNLPAFSRHEWSLVIVDDDESSNTVLKNSFRADFKMYITGIKMKENLHKFTQIYEWLYPEEAKEKNKWKFNQSDFITNSKNPLDMVEKAILLDAFMEDIVVTTEEADTPTEEHKLQSEITDHHPSITISRKNKDATGTKIKRSKRKIYDDEDDNDIPLRKTIKELLSSSKESRQVEYVLPASCNEGKCKVSASIHNKGNVRDELSLRKNSQVPDIKMDTLNSQSQLDLFYEPDTVTEMNSDRYYEMDTLVLNNDSCENQITNDNDPIQVITNDLSESGESKENNLRPDDEIFSEIVKETESNNQNKISSKNINLVHISIKTPESDEQTKSEKSSTDNIKSNNNDIKLDIAFEDSQSICNEMNVNDNELEISKESNEIYTKNKLCKSKLDISKDLITDEESNIIMESNQNEFHENGIRGTFEVVAPVANLLKHNCIEDKIKDMEEKALKKFKGSILDNLF